MNFIELTSVKGEKVIINADKISGICQSDRDDGGVMMVIDKEVYDFKEKYEKLKEMLLPLEINFGGSNGVLNCAKGED